jgi:hypothetical protein
MILAVGEQIRAIIHTLNMRLIYADSLPSVQGCVALNTKIAITLWEIGGVNLEGFDMGKGDRE